MRNVGIVVVSLLLSLLGTGGARAQATLDGLPLVAQWTDFENQAGELPVNIWGQCAARRANRIGIRVDFPGGNGTPAFATYSGVADHWNEDEDTFL